MLKPQPQEDLHHQRGPEDLDLDGSLKDVPELAGHANLGTTQRYIDANPEAQIRVVGFRWQPHLAERTATITLLTKSNSG